MQLSFLRNSQFYWTLQYVCRMAMEIMGLVNSSTSCAAEKTMCVFLLVCQLMNFHQHKIRQAHFYVEKPL